MSDQIDDSDVSGQPEFIKSARTSSRRSRVSLRNLRGSWSLCSIPEDESASPKFNLLIRRHSRHLGDLHLCGDDEEHVFHRSPVTAANGYKPSLLMIPTNPDTFTSESSPSSLETSPDVASWIRSDDRNHFLCDLLQLLSSVVQNVVILSGYICCAACWTISAFLTSYYIQR